LYNHKTGFSSSLASTISVALVSIIALGLVTIFSLMWATDQTDQDAQAINLSGSIRMQTYRVALAIAQRDSPRAMEYIQQLDATWQHSLFGHQRQKPSSSQPSQHFLTAEKHWREVLRPLLEASLTSPQSVSLPIREIDNQLALTERVVDVFQTAAESKIRRLRIIQLIALFLTIAAGSIIFSLIRTRLGRPLAQLTDAAYRIGKGDYGYQTAVEGSDELALLGSVVNQMSSSVEQIYRDMDDQVKQRTVELHNNNVALEFLFATARNILTSYQKQVDYQLILDQLGEVIGAEMRIELCLFTQQGDRPYMHIAPTNYQISDCSQRSCSSCAVDRSVAAMQTGDYSFTISKEQTSYGVINCHCAKKVPLQDWQQRLLRSVADQFALALSLSAHKDQERRLAMLDERTVIARELHDSLAQSLSYLKIQVTRLQKSIDDQAFNQQQPIVDELREGLTSAYRQLRELLTTFRLKIDTGGLHSALELVVNQLNQRSDMQVTLHYKLTNLPLSPTEEIHLLQIIREASQNAINHSLGTALDIHLFQNNDKSIQLLIDDNGIGIPNKAEKTNHYGLAIIQERSRHLNGTVEIAGRAEGGTRVAFSFRPSFLS